MKPPNPSVKRSVLCESTHNVRLKPSVKKCVLCGSRCNVQDNHLGGRHNLASFTMPFCGRCHRLFHAMVDRAGIDLRYTDDPIERVRRALAAIKIAEWMLLEQLKNNTQSKGERSL